MRVDTKIAGALDRWYLWHWTHDANVCRLYTAASPLGPYTERTVSIPNPPTGYVNNPPGGHGLSAGDVVWDPPYFYSTPHGLRLDGTSQNTFLLRSSDGRTWNYVSTTPILSAGSGNSFDNYAATYARVLRDFDGRLVRLNGKAIIYYRGEQWPNGDPSKKRYAVGAATSPDLLTWTKLTTNEPLFDPLDGALHGMGSAIWQWDELHTYLIISIADIFVPAQMWLKESTGRNDIAAFDDGPGSFLYQDAALLNDGGSYAVDGTTGIHYMAFGSGNTEGACVNLVSNLVKSG